MTPHGAAAASRPSGDWIVGVDIGGTNLRAGLLPFGGGEPVALLHRPTRPEDGAAAVVERVVEMIGEAADRAGGGSVAGVGVGCPGPLDLRRGVVLRTPNLGWTDLPLRDLIERGSGLRAAVDNDANCAAYGEWLLGAGRGARLLVGITVGTGIGGGIVLDGEIHRGACGAAGEIGHMAIAQNGRLCPCGVRGCVEAYASGPAIAERAVEGIMAGEASRLAPLVRDDPARLTAEALCEAAAHGDGYAARVLAETAGHLAVAVASLVNVLNPDAVVIGGGVAAAGDLLLDPLREAVRRRAFPSAFGACRIVAAELPHTAGVVGAAGVFRTACRGAA